MTRRAGPSAADRRRTGRGIEVGHIFAFGTKYSASMGLKVSDPTASMVTPQMGSYGIGVSRLVGAIIEASHDDSGIVWPEAVAPWKVGLVTMRADDAASRRGRRRHLRASSARPASRPSTTTATSAAAPSSASMDLIGLPWQLIVGPRGLAHGTGRAQEPPDRRAARSFSIEARWRG